MRADVKAHIFAISKRWLAPDGDTTNGIDGYRLDVADQIPLGFWREYRTFVKSVKPDAMLIGEIWWESWPHRLMNPAPYCKGDIFDAVMFYQVYRPARYFFAQTNFPIDAKMLQDSLNFQWNRLAEPFRYAQMNVNATHDAPRLLTCFANPNLYKYHANWFADSSYNQGAVTADTRQRVKLYLAHQFTMIGAPAIWNGDEMGMWGGDDPDCRKPLWWPDYTFEPETQRTLFPERSQDQDALSPASTRGNTNSTRLSTIPRPIPPAGVGFDSAHYAYYKKLARVRNENPVLARGKIEFLDGGNRMLVYRRYDGKSEIIALFNVDTQPKQFSLPPGSFEDLLGGQKGLGNTVTVAPMQAMILRKG
jgi:glycosidase